MNKLLQRFLNEKVAVRLRTQDEYDQFMNLLEEKTDILWCSGNKPTQRHHWSQHKEEFAVKYRNSTDDEWWIGMSYGDCVYFKRIGTQLIEFEDLLKGEEKIMTPAEKLRFLADRAEDGKEFVRYGTEYCFSRGILLYKSGGEWLSPSVDFMGMVSGESNFELKPQWVFAEDEKAILRNLPCKYRYIARDGNDMIFVFTEKPTKDVIVFRGIAYRRLDLFGHLFKSVQWSDEEACEFREYL